MQEMAGVGDCGIGARYVKFARSEKAHKDRKVERCDHRKVSPQEMGTPSRFAQQVSFFVNV
jgi:hypothetical protein